MEFKPGWLNKQIALAIEEIDNWSETKRRTMLRDDYEQYEVERKLRATKQTTTRR